MLNAIRERRVLRRSEIQLPPKSPAGVDRKIRIGFLTPTLMFGGAERWVAALAAGLDRQLFDVVGVAVLHGDKIFPEIGKTVESRCSIIRGANAFQTLAASCDLLIAWGLMTLESIRGFPGKVVMVAHGHCPWTEQAIRGCLPQVTHWTSVSRHASNSFPDPTRVVVVHNGIDAWRCRPKRPREEVRKEWGVSSGEIAVGYVGRLSCEKNWEAIPMAVNALGGWPFRAVIVGSGVQVERQVARARRINPEVVYCPPVENVGDVYRALDCFVLVSPSEGFSLALTEAWYCGCPTVATPVGATELMEMHGDLSVQVPVGATPREIGAAIQKAVADENREVVARAKAVVTERYTSQEMCKRWDAYLSGLFE